MVFKLCVCVFWCNSTAVLGESLPLCVLEVWFCEVMWQVRRGLGLLSLFVGSTVLLLLLLVFPSFCVDPSLRHVRLPIMITVKMLPFCL